MHLQAYLQAVFPTSILKVLAGHLTGSCPSPPLGWYPGPATVKRTPNFNVGSLQVGSNWRGCRCQTFEKQIP